MVVSKSKNFKLVRRITIGFFLFLFLPILLAFFLPFLSGFAPSPIVNNTSNWLGIIFGILIALMLVSTYFYSVAVRTDGKKIDKRTGPLLALFMPWFIMSMYAGLFKSVGGKFLHGFSKQECHFIRDVKKTANTGGKGGTQYFLDLVGSEEIPFNLRISKKEYNRLPNDTFIARIYATQSVYGVKVDKYLLEDKKLEIVDQKYKNKCDAYWVLEPMQKRDNLFFYWY